MNRRSSKPDTASWPSTARDLWGRIQGHVFDQPGSALPFSKRLARDNAWQPDFSAAVLEEYRRFAFLAGVAEHPVTPSDEVDQAWHLHLLYTRDYWQVFCPEVLRFELHHGPTKGGEEQGETFLEQYSQTRHSYRQWFGVHPPASIWPPAEQRFGRDTRWVRVNRDDWELVERREPLRGKLPTMLDALLRRLPGRSLGLFVAMLAMATSAAAQDPRPDSLLDAGLNPYALSATGFLIFFAVVTLPLAVLIPWFARRRLVAEGAGRGLDTEPADVFETAMLLGGERRALLTAVTWLVDGGYARVVGNQMTVEELPPDDAHSLVRAMAGNAPGKQSARDVMTGRKCRRQLRALRQGLVDRGLLLERDAHPKLSLVAVVALPVVIALPRILAALGADRPFGYLVLLGLVAIVLGVTAWSRLVGLFDGATEGGRQVLSRYGGARARPSKDYEGGVVASAAVFGVGALGFSDIADVERFAQAGMRPSAGASGGGTGCGDGGGGGGGGGCGGGGCGGCGG